MDSISEARLQSLVPELQEAVRKAAGILEAEGIVFRIVQGFRTWAEQDALYAQGRTAPGAVVTRARGGQSAHNFGIAVDCTPDLTGTMEDGFQPNWNASDPSWVRMEDVMESCGLSAGAKWRTFPDNPHFEYLGKFEHVPNDAMRQAFLNGGLEAVWAMMRP